MVSAIIVAAGKGRRMHAGTRKQYLTVAGRTVLGHTLKKFDVCDDVDSIYLVVPEEDFDYCREKVLSPANLRKPTHLVVGGKQRQNSVFNGLKALEQKRGLVVVHDGVRPLIEPQQISSCIAEAQESGACILGIPAFDTIKRVDDANTIEATINRECLWLAQTPQVFRYKILHRAHQKAISDGFAGTDDALLVERIGYRVKIITGSKTNLKITTTEDLAIAQALLEDGRRIRTFYGTIKD
jgi:2-C-methyl-D-erythritol 4-phosphate cytidylyltransferase